MPRDVDHPRQRDQSRRRSYRGGHGSARRSLSSCAGRGPHRGRADPGRAGDRIGGGRTDRGADRRACCDSSAKEGRRVSVVQRDYIERMIVQFAQAIGEIVAAVRAGDFDLALITVRRTSDLVLGNLGPVFERLDAASVVEFVGKYDLDRVRMFAALQAEEGTIRELRGQIERAQYCFRRTLELYAAISMSGARLKTADWERIV